MKKWMTILMLCALLAGCARQTKAELSIYFFEAGKADAILIRTDSSAVLVDAGLEKKADELIEKMRALKVDKLDAMVITHFDKDHVGGADAVLASFPVQRVFQPSYEKDSKQYGQYLEAMEAAGIEPEILTENASFSLDGAEYAVDVANQFDYGPDEENDFSLVIRMTYQEASALLAGDAEEARMDELLAEGGLKSDVLKVPHHGRYHRNTPAFAQAVQPDWAVITSSPDEPEDGETLDALKQTGARICLTRQGDVCLATDGKTWWEG